MREEIIKRINEEEIHERAKQLAEQISKDYEGKKIHLVCVLSGSVFFMCELAKYITVPVTLDFIRVSSYGDAMDSSGTISIVQDLKIGIEDRDVLIVEDIVDSGRTVALLRNIMKKRNPASLRICTMLNKPSRRVTPVEVEYSGFEIEDYFVVGFGLDYAQKYRNLPYIGELKVLDE